MLVGSFACEVLGLRLCVHSDRHHVTQFRRFSAHAVKSLVGRDTAMGFLQANHEFEYLTCRLSFLNGLLSWLGAVALKYAIPRDSARFAVKVLRRKMPDEGDDGLMVSFYTSRKMEIKSLLVL